MKLTRTITIDGKTEDEYMQIVAYLEAEVSKSEGWELIKDPLANRVTAVKSVEVQAL